MLRLFKHVVLNLSARLSQSTHSKNSEMVEIKFDKSTSLEALTSFAITKDPEGKEIITVIDDGSLKCNKKILINTKTLSSELSKYSSYF